MFRLLLVVVCVLGGTILHAADFYVAPNGSDDAAGTKTDPFASLEKVRDVVRQARNDGKIKEDETATVYLGSGRYFLDSSFELDDKDSGTEKGPLVFQALNESESQIVGGVEIPVDAFKKVEDAAILKRLDAQVRNNILVADLDSLNIPATEPWGDNFRGRPNAPPELFYNEQPMTVARWPNEGWTGFKSALDSGMPHNETTEENVRKAAEKAGVRFVHPEVDTSRKHGGAFVYDEETLKVRDPERFARWNVEEGVWLCGYWTHDWSDEVLKVASIDTKEKTLALRGVHGYGIGGSSWAGYSERRYFALNILEELDAPGEWYLDRKTNKLYFYPPKKLGKGDSVLLSTLTHALVRMKNASFVQFRNLTFGPTFAGAVDMEGGRGNQFLGCRIRNTGSHGIHIGGGENHRVQSCDVHNIGSVGVAIYAGDRKTLTPANHLAENNHVHHFGRLNRTYAGAFALHGVGNTVRNNRIHAGPHLAISYGGNENRIQRNEIFDVVTETSDAGALYTGRDWTTQGNVVEENFIHHLGTSDSHATMGVYLDDCDSGDTIRRNVFYKASRAVFIGGGRDNIVENNLFVECYQGISLDSRGMSWKQWNTPGDGWNLEEKAENLNYKNPPWSERYPKLAATMQNEPKAPLGCVFQRNVMIDCKQWMRLDGEVLKLLERTDLKDNVVVRGNLVVENVVKSDELRLPEKERGLQRGVRSVDPGFINVQKLDFRFKKNSEVQKLLPKGFEPIPFEKIGNYVDEYRKSVGK